MTRTPSAKYWSNIAITRAVCPSRELTPDPEADEALLKDALLIRRIIVNRSSR